MGASFHDLWDDESYAGNDQPDYRYNTVGKGKPTKDVLKKFVVFEDYY
jgi:hypothetical protein